MFLCINEFNDEKISLFLLLLLCNTKNHTNSCLFDVRPKKIKKKEQF